MTDQMTCDVEATLAQGLEAHRAGRHAEAEALYRAALTADAGNANGWHLLGALAIDTGHPAVAVDLLTQAIRRGPAVGERHFSLGLAHSALHQTSEAIAALRQAVRYDPLHVGAWNNLALLLRDTGAGKESIAAAQRAVDLRPDLPTLHVNLAIAAIFASDWQTGNAAARRTVALAPDHLDGYFYLGDVMVTLGDLTAAAWAFERTQLMAPEKPETHNNLGHVRREQGDLATAEAMFAKALDMRPGYPDAFNNLNALQVGRTFGEVQAAWRLAHPTPRVTTDLGGPNPPPPVIIENVLTPAECATIVALGPELPEFKGLVGQTKGVDAEAVRRSTIRWVVCDRRTRFIYEKVLNALFEAADDQYGFPLTGIEPMQLAHYDQSDEGFYDWHFDTVYFPRPDKPVRRLSISMQLTPEAAYDGGGLEMKRPDGVIVAARTQGAAIIFPSNTVHRVEPVRRGRRHSLVMWALGPHVPGC